MFNRNYNEEIITKKNESIVQNQTIFNRTKICLLLNDNIHQNISITKHNIESNEQETTKDFDVSD